MDVLVPKTAGIGHDTTLEYCFDSMMFQILRALSGSTSCQLWRLYSKLAAPLLFLIHPYAFLGRTLVLSSRA
jgi:hypothetical protein